jgi:hypothetical protein
MRWDRTEVWCFALVASVAINVLVGCAGFFLGTMSTEARIDRRRTAEETEALAPILAGDPAFKDVQILKLSSGGVQLSGTVPTSSARERLRAQVMKALGEVWLASRFFEHAVTVAHP